ncbi:MAG: sortase [Actinobacteria bacterium]|nr:sortase [Actinomycetota bacterium]
MSDIDTRAEILEHDVFGIPMVDPLVEAPRTPSTKVRLARRVAVVLLVFSFGSIVFGSVIAPLVHERRSTMLEEQLASDLINGVAPVSNPIAVGTPIGLIEIPARGVRAVVVEGTTAEQLSKGAGHLIGSALPGQPGVSAVLGRSRNHGAEFANLDEVEVGDSITATTGQGEHSYEVLDVTVRASRDMAAFEGEGHMLILSTVVDGNDRLVVRAGLTSPVLPAGTSIEHVTSSDELGLVGDSSSWLQVAVWLFVAALIALAHPFVVRQVGQRVAWMVVSPVAMWIAVETWSALSLTGPAAL